MHASMLPKSSSAGKGALAVSRLCAVATAASSIPVFVGRSVACADDSAECTTRGVSGTNSEAFFWGCAVQAPTA
eukprot:8590350-Alexandrium_andersonii.AAC.1